MKSKIAELRAVVRADDARVGRAALLGVPDQGQELVSSNSRLMVAKNDSASALSQHCPVGPTDRRTPNSVARVANCWLVYWQPRSEWKITGRVGRRCRQA
jgi:hypothetical protein